ncbi:MAG: glycosyltransferase N-terminal domain-containing protein [bacterium]
MRGVGERAPVWFHGASVGDMRALAPLVAAVAAARPTMPAHVSATTRDGRRLARRLFPAATHSRPPLGPWPGRALDRIGPRLIVLEYLELWPAWIAAAARRRIPVAVVDGRVTHRSLRIRPLLARAAGRLALFCARTEADAAAARALGVAPDRIRVTGNGKYDGVPLAPPAPDEALCAAIGAREVVVGSLHPDEERPALEALADSGLRAVVAPRYPRRADAILRFARRRGITAARRTASSPAAQWVVLDTIGELAAAYAIAPVAIVGGTFGRRDGQNLVEPAAHGRPVIHGPRIANVAVEAAALAGRGGWPAPDWPAACALARARLADPGPDPRPALVGLTGATARNLDALLPFLDSL